MSKLFIVFIVIAAVVVIGVVFFSVRQPTSQDTVTVVADATTSSEGEIMSYDFGNGNRLNVMPADYQTMVLNEIAVQERQSITIGSAAGERLTVTSAKDGSPTDVVQVILDRTLYDFRGSNDFLSHLDDYVTFTN